MGPTLDPSSASLKPRALRLWPSLSYYSDGVGGPIRVWEFTKPVVHWLPTLRREIKEIERKFSPEQIEVAFSKSWSERQDFREWMDEVNNEEIEELRKQKEKQ